MTSTSDVFAADWILPVDGPAFGPGWIAVNEGAIVEVKKGPAPPGSHQFGPAAILPGFINLHTHLACQFLKDLPEAPSFLDWVDGEVKPRVLAATKDDFAQAARAAAQELLEGGVSYVLDSFFDAAGREALAETGQRGLFAREFFGVSAPSRDAYLADSLSVIDKDLAAIGVHDVGYALAPHAPYTCPQDVLSGLAHRAKENDLVVTIHCAESPEEEEAFRRGLGPMAERYRIEGTGTSPLMALASAGALGRKTLLVHMVQATPEDLDLCAETGAAIIHCPTSNARLGVGVLDLEAVFERAIPCALGTDSAASSGKLDMFEEMRNALSLQRALKRSPTALTSERVLRMATLDAAHIVGRKDLGSLTPGQRADFSVVALDRHRHQPFRDVTQALVLTATPDDVVGVWIDGVARYQRGDAS